MPNNFEKKHIEFKFDNVAEDGTISGYASIIGNTDGHGDIVEAGAFKNTLKSKNVADIPLLWQHDTRQPIGSILELSEDSKGLKFKGKILLSINKGREARELAVAGIIKGVSIGYVAKKWVYNESYTRVISEIDLWEISLVTFPANSSAGIEDVKSSPNKRIIEDALTQDAGLTRKQARLLLSSGFKAAFPTQDAGEDDEKNDDTLDAVEEKTRLLKEIKSNLKLTKE